MVVLVSILGAFGASRAWLKRPCASLDVNKGEVEDIKKQLEEIKAALLKVISRK